MAFFNILLHIIFYAIGGYLLLNCLYLLFFSLAGHKRAGIQPLISSSKRKFCILIPAYQENNVILETSKAARQHVYDGEVDVYVIADGLKPETIKTIQSFGVFVIEVAFKKSTKGKALAKALAEIQTTDYEIALVLDVDNIMEAGFLQNINTAFNSGYKVVQAHRTAKNLDSTFAFLDACNEEINNHIYRKGHYAIGMSSALIGSGMAFEYNYLKQLLDGIGETVGEDKEIDFRIVKDGVKICYLNDTYVYDEKIENAQVFTNQRSRWIAAQIEFLKKYAGEGIRQLVKKGNVEFFNKVVQAFLVPRVLLLGILGALFLVSFVNPFGPSSVFWGILCVMLAAALFIALPGKYYRDKRLWSAILNLPNAFFCMCLALLNIKKAKASFIATPHKSKSVSSQVNS